MRLKPIIRTWSASALAWLVLGLASASTSAVAPGDPGVAAELDRAAEGLRQGEYDEAAAVLDALPPGVTDRPLGRYLRGWLSLVRGDYADAARLIRSAVEAEKSREEWKPLRDLADIALKITSEYVTVRDDQGRFVIRHTPGRDAVLVPYIRQILERQSEHLARILGDPGPKPVVVEIVPDIDTLSALAEMDQTDAERTGTVAVSHFGRVLILSPAALERGYPWQDTLAHEMVHLVVTRLSRDRAPGWLHEGLARLIQSAWTGQDPMAEPLTPVEAYLLDMASRQGRLIPIGRLGVPLYRWPSQEDAVLALAQSASFTQYLGRREGPAAWKEILGRLREGMGVADAIASTWDSPFGRVVSWWRQSLQGRRLAPRGAVRLLGRRFRKGTIALNGAALGFQDPWVTRKLRAADLLSLRGHVDAAAAEYRQAADRIGDPDPVIANKLARCEILLGRFDKAIERLQPLAPLYPHLPATFTGLGEAYRQTGQWELASRALRQSLALDPFDRHAVCTLSEILRAHGPADGASEVERHCEALGEFASGDTGSSDPGYGAIRP